jgi:hypothetical protein
MSYTEFKDGYARETTFKDGTTIDDAADTAYLFGALSDKSEWPSPQYTMNYTATGVNVKEVGAGLLWKSAANMRGMLGLVMQNGILCELAMGKSTTAGGGPYTHTIVPCNDGSLLHSIVIQHEEKGTATDEEYQFQGVKVDSLVLSHDAKGVNQLMARVEIMAAKATDPGFALTNDPALPATANAAPYTALTRTWDYGGTPLSIDGLQKIEIAIINGLTPQYAHSYDTGVYTGRWPYMFTEAWRKEYLITLTMYKNTIERAMWDELITASNTKEALFKWTRSANDYIQVTATDCSVTVHPVITPEVGEGDLIEVQLVPRALSIEVKDMIAGGYYGE